MRCISRKTISAERQSVNHGFPIRTGNCGLGIIAGQKTCCFTPDLLIARLLDVFRHESCGR